MAAGYRPVAPGVARQQFAAETGEVDGGGPPYGPGGGTVDDIFEGAGQNNGSEGSPTLEVQGGETPIEVRYLNMCAETFTSWQPHEALPRRVEVASIRDEEEGLCVVLACEETHAAIVKLVFEDFVGYRNVNESFRTRTWQSQDMGALSSLLIVERSLWIKWLCEESSHISDEASLTHYAIYTMDDCIDVATRRAPIVIALAPAPVPEPL